MPEAKVSGGEVDRVVPVNQHVSVRGGVNRHTVRGQDASVDVEARRAGEGQRAPREGQARGVPGGRMLCAVEGQELEDVGGSGLHSTISLTSSRSRPESKMRSEPRLSYTRRR